MCLINNIMKAELEEIAEIARGATEREIETEVVHILKRAGWPRSQINQDVPISDKGADKADIVLKLDNQPVILVEVKKYGHSKDADNQVNRYCRLLRPSPKLAILTDGIRWVLYYVGHIGAIPIQDATIPTQTDAIVSILNVLAPENLSALLQAGVFQYLDIIEQGLQDRSEETQKHLRSFFALTVKSLLLGHQKPAQATPSVQIIPEMKIVHSIEQSENISTNQKQSNFQGNTLSTEYDPLQPPSLDRTNIKASFAEETATNWNQLLRIAVKVALDAGLTKQDIQRIGNMNIQDGNLKDKGFTPITGANLSVQGQPSGQAWQNTLMLARKAGCRVLVEFQWKDDEKAAYPGKHGIMRWHP